MKIFWFPRQNCSFQTVSWMRKKKFRNPGALKKVPLLGKVLYTHRPVILSKNSFSQRISASHEGSTALLITFLDNALVIKQTKISWKKNFKEKATFQHPDKWNKWRSKQRAESTIKAKQEPKGQRWSSALHMASFIHHSPQRYLIKVMESRKIKWLAGKKR